MQVDVPGSVSRPDCKSPSVLQQGKSGVRLDMMRSALSPQHASNDVPKEESSSSYITHSYFQFCGYQLKIAQILGANLGVSAYVWDAGVALCQYFEKANIIFSGKRVIELGSGTGIVGILATLLGGDVTLTDQPNVLKQIEKNVIVNVPAACRHRLQIRPLIWGENHTDFPNDYDFILGSDIVYSSVAYPALVETLCYLAKKGSTVYLSSELRKRNGSPSFHEENLPQYFNCQVIDRLENKDITLYKMTKIDTNPSTDRNQVFAEPGTEIKPASPSSPH